MPPLFITPGDNCHTAQLHNYRKFAHPNTRATSAYSEPGDVIESTAPTVADYSDDYCGTISIDTFLLIVASAADCGVNVCAPVQLSVLCRDLQRHQPGL